SSMHRMKLWAPGRCKDLARTGNGGCSVFGPAAPLEGGAPEGHATVDGDGRAYHVVAGARGEVDGGPGHVLVAADPAGRHPASDVLGIIARGLVHVRCEGPRRDRAHDDVLPDQPRGHAPGQVDQAGLARRVWI